MYANCSSLDARLESKMLPKYAFTVVLSCCNRVFTGTITFHLHLRPPDQPRRKKKKASGARGDTLGDLLQRFPFLIEVNPGESTV